MFEVEPADGLGVGLGHRLRDGLGGGLGFRLRDGFGDGLGVRRVVRRSEGFEDGTRECLEDELDHGLIGISVGVGVGVGVESE